MCAPISEPFSNTQTETSRAFLSRQLLQSNGRRQAGRSAADDHDVVFHRFALHVRILRAQGWRRRPRAQLYNSCDDAQIRLACARFATPLRWGDTEAEIIASGAADSI
jgi:hypothetical protein